MKLSAGKNDRVFDQRKISRYNRDRNQGIITETVLKLFFSLMIGMSGIISLIKLVPHHNNQQGKLKELRAQVKETEIRVSKLRKELSRNFDPQQTQSLVEEYTALTAPNRIHVFVRDINNAPTPDSKIISDLQKIN